MIQIAPNFVIGLPDYPSTEEWNDFIRRSNQQRLKAMQESGINITEYSEEDWKIFKK